VLPSGDCARAAPLLSREDLEIVIQSLEPDLTVEAHHAAADVPAAALDHAEWTSARAVWITRYWSGTQAPDCRHAEARLIWSSAALGVRFVCLPAEPLIAHPHPQLDRKTIGLWERDVCEIFIAPDIQQPERYLEFEAAPTGEWLDLGIHQRPDRRETDWDLQSGMTAAARIGANEIVIAMRVPWEAFGRAPQAGERWRANLFRCVGAGPERGYLAWSPTRTAQPNFHVPAAFGWLRFAQ
jgi:alpha-galactosidase